MTVAQEKVVMVVAEGRVAEINIDPLKAREIRPRGEGPDEPIVFTFYGPYNFYIKVFDHRPEIRMYFDSGDNEGLKEAFGQTPCLVGFRLHGRTQYIVIVPVGWERNDIRDGGEKDQYLFTRRGEYDPKVYKILGDGKYSAVHIDTGICLTRRKVAK